MNGYLVALLCVMSFALGVVVCMVASVLGERRRPLAPVLDLSAAAARGDLMHLDWGDARGRGWENLPARTKAEQSGGAA